MEVMRLAKAFIVSAELDVLVEVVVVDVREDRGAQGLGIGTLLSLPTCVLSAGNIRLVSLSTKTAVGFDPDCSWAL